MSAMASRDRLTGAQIKRARERRHLTQQDLADRLGVDRKTVDNWENSRTYPRNRVGALEEWAPELAPDADPEEAAYAARLAVLQDEGYMTAAEAAGLIKSWRDRRSRDASAQRAS
jgi:transcriptional regulator with XRE-family HTH domain